MSRLRVLHLGKFYAPEKGGMETALQTLCRGEQPVVETHALVMNRARKTTHDVVDGVPVTRVASWLTIGAVAFAPGLPFRLARAKADVIVLHEPNPMALVAWFLVRPKAPLVIWYHSEVVRPRWRYQLFYRPFLESALGRAVRIVVASPPMQNVPALAAYRTKCVVIPYGLDSDRYQPTPAVRARADTLREPARAPILLFIGRLVPYKGLDVLLQALPGLDARTVIVGDGPLRRSLETMVRELGLGDRVELTGAVADDERLAWLHACDALVLPSSTRQEAFGMVQLEAMLCGRPVVSTDVPTGVPWVNVHGETGFVVRAGDAASLRDALDRIVADAAGRKALGATALARALTAFSADKMCAAAFDLYQDLSRLTGSAQVNTAKDLAGRRGTDMSSSMVPAVPELSGWVPKRAFDVALSGAGLLLSAPLWALFAAAVKLQDGGPVFYRQEQSGRDGCAFDVLKFRSMIPQAEAGTGAVQAHRSDRRVTAVGRLLRATAMDELPQLWNILRGDMSFVGPRALRPGEIEARGDGQFERLEDVPGFAERSRVRPGLTGIAQIYAPRDIPRRLKFRYDLLYVRRQSVWLDLRLVLLSFWITARGAWEADGRKF